MGDLKGMEGTLSWEVARFKVRKEAHLNAMYKLGSFGLALGVGC